MAIQRGRRPEKLRKELIKSGELEQIFVQIRERKTLEAILTKAKVTEVDPEDASKPAKPKPKTKAKSKPKPKAKP